MGTENSTIKVMTLANKPVIVMQWNREIVNGDVEKAYEVIETLLDQAETPHCILVDLTSNPRMPLTETLVGALRGRYTHPMIKCWLVVGKHHFGQIVARTLEQITKVNLVTWFNSMAEVEAYIEASLVETDTP